MQVTELSADGLKREYKIVVHANEIESRISGRLNELSRTVRMPGFRPGKVPVSLLRKQYGRSVMGEVVEHGRTGMLAPVGSDLELAQAILQLMSDPELRRSVGHAGRQRAEERFTEQAMHSAYSRVYAEMIGVGCDPRRVADGNREVALSEVCK